MESIRMEKNQRHIPGPRRRVGFGAIFVDDNFQPIRWFLRTSRMSAGKYTGVDKCFNAKVCGAHGWQVRRTDRPLSNLQEVLGRSPIAYIPPSCRSPPHHPQSVILNLIHNIRLFSYISSSIAYHPALHFQQTQSTSSNDLHFLLEISNGTKLDDESAEPMKISSNENSSLSRLAPFPCRRRRLPRPYDGDGGFSAAEEPWGSVASPPPINASWCRRWILAANAASSPRPPEGQVKGRNLDEAPLFHACCSWPRFRSRSIPARPVLTGQGCYWC